MPIAQQVWLVYLGIAFVLMPVIFWMRFGKWPFAIVLNRFSVYQIVEFFYAIVLGFYTWSLFRDVTPIAKMETTGLVITGLSALWIFWSVLVMGRSWRLGQDDRDPDVEYIRSGPFAVMPHPIYVGMVVFAIGMFFLDTEAISRCAFFLLTTLAYTIIQSMSEGARWKIYRGG